MTMTLVISASVGAGGANRPPDVVAVQTALNRLTPFRGGPDPKLVPDGLIGTNTLRAIDGFQRFLGFGQPDDRIDPGGRTLGELNRMLRLDASVEADMALIPQPTALACWAAALAMVVSWRAQAAHTPGEVATAAGMDLSTQYDWLGIRGAVRAWDLMEEGAASATAAEWAEWLRRWGPLWVVVKGNPLHAVVIVGVQGDGEQDTWVKRFNPAPVGQGAVEEVWFTDFVAEYDLGATAPAVAALVHARR
jgi:peptidoglycan hydrolase-like protein with peptidoglycan-binding domain